VIYKSYKEIKENIFTLSI